MPVKILNLSHFKAAKVIFLGVLLLIFCAVIYFPNYAKLRKLRQVNNDLQVKNKKLVKEIKVLQVKLKKIGKDPYLYEKIARDNLGVARENEIVVDIAE
ncbi:MAG: septum formation initiator family protein [Candidatus Omnitrophica bacterium]|nr:septum formation initiator family protein [Candidatus Omnitrophota bacterium]